MVAKTVEADRLCPKQALEVIDKFDMHFPVIELIEGGNVLDASRMALKKLSEEERMQLKEKYLDTFLKAVRSCLEGDVQCSVPCAAEIVLSFGLVPGYGLQMEFKDNIIGAIEERLGYISKEGFQSFDSSFTDLLEASKIAIAFLDYDQRDELRTKFNKCIESILKPSVIKIFSEETSPEYKKTYNSKVAIMVSAFSTKKEFKKLLEESKMLRDN